MSMWNGNGSGAALSRPECSRPGKQQLPDTEGRLLISKTAITASGDGRTENLSRSGSPIIAYDDLHMALCVSTTSNDDHFA